MPRRKKERPAWLNQPPPKTAGIKLPRLKQYRKLITDLVNARPEKGKKGTHALSGYRRALLVLLMAWMDAYDYPDVQKVLLSVIEWSYVKAKPETKLASPVDANAVIEDAHAAEPADEAATEKIKNIFEMALKGE